MRQQIEVVKPELPRPKRKEVTAKAMEERLKTIDEWRRNRLAEIRAQKPAP